MLLAASASLVGTQASIAKACVLVAHSVWPVRISDSLSRYSWTARSILPCLFDQDSILDSLSAILLSQSDIALFASPSKAEGFPFPLGICIDFAPNSCIAIWTSAASFPWQATATIFDATWSSTLFFNSPNTCPARAALEVSPR